jgi:hypothetical protein
MVSEEIRGMIPDYVHGLLNKEDAETVQNALSSFPELSPEYEAVRRYYTVLNQLQETEAPLDFVDRVNRGIDRKPFLQRVGDILFKPFWIKIPVEFAGVAACLIAVVLIIKPNLPTTTPHDQQAIALSRKVEPVAELALKIPEPEKKVAQKQPSSSSGSSVRAAAPKEPRMAKSTAPPVAKAAASVSPVPTATRDYATTPPSVPAPTGAKPEADPVDGDSARKNVSIAVVDIGTIDLAYTQDPSSNLRKRKNASRTESGAAMAGKTIEEKPSANEKTPPPPGSTMQSAQDEEISTVAVSEILDAILVNYDSLLTISSQNGKILYTLVISPDHLSSVSKKLERSFRITSRLLPFDPLVAKKVKVTFSVTE